MTENMCFGYVPDLKDIRDYSILSEKMSPIMRNINFTYVKEIPTLPEKVDLSGYCGNVESQNSLGSCTAHAGTSLMELCLNVSTNQRLNYQFSRLFLYWTTRRFLNWDTNSDMGATIKGTMGALCNNGVCREKYYPYVPEQYKNAPDSFSYSDALNYKPDIYWRMDAIGMSLSRVVENMRLFLANKMGLMLGFAVYQNAINDGYGNGGFIAYPDVNDRLMGYHAVMVCGYDDKLVIKNRAGFSYTGAFKIKNSWGSSFGDKGFGWLPYQYVLSQLAQDVWGLMRLSWVETGQFGVD